jgi:oligopeptide transport system permease protein
MARLTIGDRVALATLGGLVLLGLAAPLAERGLTHFSLEEQHALFLQAPAGSADVPVDHPTWDGDPAGFALLDRGGDGRLDDADLAAAEGAARGLLFLGARFDADRDGRVTRAEVPADAPSLAGVADLLGADWADRLDLDGDGALTTAEIVAGSRALRLRPAHVALQDDDGDGVLERAEWRGAPELATFWLGTDYQGRDLLTRVLYGLRLSVVIGLAAALVSAFIGALYGGLAGYAGGWVDRLLMRGIDVLYAVPFLFVISILVMVLGQGLGNLLLAIGLVQWLPLARVVRGEVARLCGTDLYLSARLLGLPAWRVLGRHLLPMALVPVAPFATLLVPAAILDEAFLSFLGLGVQAPLPSLGVLLVDGARGAGSNPFALACPALVLAIILAGFHRLGEALKPRRDR